MHTCLSSPEKSMEMTSEDVTYVCYYSHIFPIVADLAETLFGVFCSSSYGTKLYDRYTCVSLYQ